MIYAEIERVKDADHWKVKVIFWHVGTGGGRTPAVPRILATTGVRVDDEAACVVWEDQARAALDTLGLEEREIP